MLPLYMLGLRSAIIISISFDFVCVFSLRNAIRTGDGRQYAHNSLLPRHRRSTSLPLLARVLVASSPPRGLTRSRSRQIFATISRNERTPVTKDGIGRNSSVNIQKSVVRVPWQPPRLTNQPTPRSYTSSAHRPSDLTLGRALDMQTFSTPLRAIIFIDGSYFFYCMHGTKSVFKEKFGDDWEDHYRLDYNRLSPLISQVLRRELKDKYMNRNVEVVRTIVISSTRPNSYVSANREIMFSNMKLANFDCILLEEPGLRAAAREKCVDIQLAVDMFHYARIDAYDICVLVTGDRDFLPMLKYIREAIGKRVAICASRTSGSSELVSSVASDFETLWLEDLVEHLVVKVDNKNKEIFEIITDYLKGFANLTSSSYDLGRYLGSYRFGEESALSLIKARFGSLHAFLRKSESLRLGEFAANSSYSVSLYSSESDDDVISHDDNESGSGYAEASHQGLEEADAEILRIFQDFLSSQPSNRADIRIIASHLKGITIGDTNGLSFFNDRYPKGVFSFVVMHRHIFEISQKGKDALDMILTARQNFTSVEEDIP